MYGENGENQNQMNSSVTKKGFKSQRLKLLRSFFRLYFCCLLDQDIKGQCRQKNWVVLRWFLPYFKEKENCVIFFLFRLWSTPDLPHRKFSYLLIAIGLASGGEGTLVKKKQSIKESRTQTLSMNTVICFFPYTPQYSMRLAFRSGNYI